MIRLMWKRFRRDRSGQALVELAIALPVLLLILLGGVELARICYASIEVTNAAHAALQYAVLNGGAFNSNDATGLDSTGMMRAATADDYDLSTTLSTPLSWASGYPTYTCTCSGTGTASCSVPNGPTGCTTSHVVTTVQVQMQTSFDPLIYVPLPGWGGSKITIYGYAQAKVLP
ncbi:MAG TPA: TadE/TadG family type IV pilus assembly protein [Terracidiphilus sp.]|nr:TadE/TadG family type IV pilus assembly protein [Terracidiphilus sp.]